MHAADVGLASAIPHTIILKYELDWEATAHALTWTLDLWLSVEVSISSGYISLTHTASHNSESYQNAYMQYMHR